MATAAELQTFLAEPLDSAVARIREALRENGFGVLTEIDVQSVLRQKLNEDFYPYRLLGVCNPNLAYRALEIDPSLGVFLPCTIALYDTGAGTQVHIQDPSLALTAQQPPALIELVDTARTALARTLGSLRPAAAPEPGA